MTEAVNHSYTEDDRRMIRLQEGDTQVFQKIVQTWQQPLFSFFLRNTRDHALSEDLVQETLLRLYRNSWDYLPRGLFRGFLFRIATNLLIDHSRRSTHDVLLHSLRSSQMPNQDAAHDAVEQIPGTLRSAQAIAIEHEVQQIIAESLRELPEEQRVTFLLHYYESLTLSEIADATSTSIPTAKGRLRLAREKLRYLLACRGFQDEPADSDGPETPEQ